jgi:D-glycero-D-manno-heptose 1,7-bisphosphate phosphatase
MSSAGASQAARPAVFLDKDGTLVEDVPYNVDPALLRLTRNAVDALRLLARHGHRLVVVTNQPGVAMNLFDHAALDRLQHALVDLLAQHDVHLDGFYACPHAAPGFTTEPPCVCRKPAPGLLLQAAEELRLDLSRSWMVGDILNDVEAGRRAGCRTVMLDVGNETEWVESPLRVPHHKAGDLLQAAELIVGAARAPH